MLVFCPFLGGLACCAVGRKSEKWRDFLVKIRKVQDQLKDAGISLFGL